MIRPTLSFRDAAMVESFERGISVVIPVYRSALSLEPLFQRLIPALEKLGCDFEIVCVNDGSPDESWQVLRRLGENPANRLTAVNLLRNFGQHSALLCGIRQARFQIVVTMDDDLQHPPEEICKLLAALNGGCDLVYATPERECHGPIRNLASVGMKRLVQMATGVGFVSKISAFRAFRTRLRSAFRDFHGPAMSIDVLLSWATNRVGAIETRRDARAFGKSNYTLRKLILHTLNMVTGFGVLPLRFATYAGFAILGAGLFSGIGMGLAAVFGFGLPDSWQIVAVLLTVFSGVQLLSLGAVGEYLGRIYSLALSRPEYVVSEVVVGSMSDGHTASVKLPNAA